MYCIPFTVISNNIAFRMRYCYILPISSLQQGNTIHLPNNDKKISSDVTILINWWWLLGALLWTVLRLCLDSTGQKVLYIIQGHSAGSWVTKEKMSVIPAFPAKKTLTGIYPWCFKSHVWVLSLLCSYYVAIQQWT